MRSAGDWLPGRAALTAAACLSVGGAGAAQAHVKWFCAFDVVGSPRGLGEMLCSDFETLVGLALAGLLGGCLLEKTPLGDAMLRAHHPAALPVGYGAGLAAFIGLYYGAHALLFGAAVA